MGNRNAFVITNFLIYIAITNTALAAEASPFALLQSSQVPDKCIGELTQEGYTDGDVFNLKECIATAPITPNRYDDAPNDVDGILVEWDYIGTINNYAVIRTEVDGDTWASHDLSIIAPKGDGFTVVDRIDGPKGCAIDSAKIENDKIIYDQATEGYGFYLKVTSELYPELAHKYPQICGDLKDSMYDFIGDFTYEVQLDKNGKVQTPKPLLFTASEEGWPPYSGRTYKISELKSFMAELCAKN